MNMAYDPDRQRLFDDWKQRAQEADILSEAVKLGAKLRRVGKFEHVGPCPACGGKDRFSVNTRKRMFNCRGAKGGDVIGMVMHVAGVDFLGACERLTGETPPVGRSQPLSQDQVEAMERRRAEAERKRAQEEADHEAYMAGRIEACHKIWNNRQPLAGSLAEHYLVNARGIPMPPMGWPAEIAFAPSLLYELDPAPLHLKPSFPCLIARVVDVAGEMIALHRIYLDPKTGKKIAREESKVTMGPSVGGAVRLGGVGPEIDVGEGLETCLAVWWITNFARPVWATLGTSGLAGVELPLEVERVNAWLDGDLPIKKHNGEYVAVRVPPGLKAGRDLRERCAEFGVPVRLQMPAGVGEKADFADVWLTIKKQREMEQELG